MLFARSEGREFKRRYKRKQPITAHPYFVPAIAVWGAALCGLAIFVLPSSTIQSVANTLGLGSSGGFARVIIAVLAGLLGMAVSRLVAQKWQASRFEQSDAEDTATTGEVDAIDPAEELGSESLDAPIGEVGASAEDDFEDGVEFETDAGDDTFEDVALDEDALEDGDILELGIEDFAEDKDVESITTEQHHENETLDAEGESQERFTLGQEFGEEPESPLVTKPSPRAKRGFPFSRRAKQDEPNEVKQVELVRAMKSHLARKTEMVETAEAEGLRMDAEANASESTQTAPVEPSAASTPPMPNPTGSAVERLRQVPPHELSLVQLVERFAAALHDHQKAAHARAAAGETNGREIALAEALKTLALFTQDGLRANLDAEIAAEMAASDAKAKPELRDAMTKLQKLRGAA
ncbi:MAG: hypothetical protein ABJP70_02290 [Erythrobacter sp.]